MKTHAEKGIIFLSAGLIIFSALLMTYSALTSTNKSPEAQENTLASMEFDNTNSDVLGLESSAVSTEQPVAKKAAPVESASKQIIQVNPPIASSEYINTTQEPLEEIKPKDFYFFSVSTDLRERTFRLKYLDGTFGAYQTIQVADGVKGDSTDTVARASIIYKMTENYTDIEIPNNPGDIKINFVKDPGQTLTTAADFSQQYDFEKKYKESLFANFGLTDYFTREEWGAPSYSAWTPDFTKITRVVVHHTATNVDYYNPDNTVRAIYNEHKIRCSDNSGYYPANCSLNDTWSDIGYNYLIDPYGHIYEGRSGGNGVVGAHAIPNGGSIGIALLGNYSSITPTTPMLESLTRLVGALAFLNDFKVIWQEGLFGHRDYLNTECPGNNVYNILPQLAQNAEVIRRSFGNVNTYRDMIGRLSFGQDFVRSNPNITDEDGNSHIYLVADNISADMRSKIKSIETWSGSNGSETFGNNVLVYVSQRLAPIFIGEVGLAIPNIQFSADLP